MAPPKGMRRTVTVRRADILDSMTLEDWTTIGDLAEHTGRSKRDIHSCLVDLGRLGWTRLVYIDCEQRHYFELTAEGQTTVYFKATEDPALFPPFHRSLRAS